MIPAILALVTAAPLTLPAAIAAAKPGDNIRLAPGHYTAITIQRKMNTNVTIDAKVATVDGLTFRNASNWTWKGGYIIGPRSQHFGVMIDGAKNIVVKGVTFSGMITGLTMYRGAENVAIIGNTFDGVRSDGMNVVWAKNVRVIGNTCRNFKPIEKVFDVFGKMVKDGDHPDCVQMWSVEGQAPTQDVLVAGNHIRGRMQGIDHFYYPDHPRMKNVQIYDNDVEVSFYHGITMQGTDGLDIRNNVVRTTPGAKDQRGRPIKTWIMVEGSPNATVCGNVVASGLTPHQEKCQRYR